MSHLPVPSSHEDEGVFRSGKVRFFQIIQYLSDKVIPYAIIS